MNTCLYFVVPCYNDEDTLQRSVPVFIKKLDNLISKKSIDADSKLLLVNDGSADNTWGTILSLKDKYKCIIAVDLVENVGEQNALLAGMFTAESMADCIITMDSDLQDDIEAVDEMLQRYYEGCDIVYGVRKTRKNDSFKERFFSAAFYRLMHFAGTGLLAQHSNYRLLSTKAIALLHSEVKRSSFFLPCVVSNMNVKSAVVYYERLVRAAGESGYNFKKKFRLAMEALLAHSNLLSIVLGTLAVLCSIATGSVAVHIFMVRRATNTVSFGLYVIAVGLLLLSAVSVYAFASVLHQKKAAIAERKTEWFGIAEIVF